MKGNQKELRIDLWSLARAIPGYGAVFFLLGFFLMFGCTGSGSDLPVSPDPVPAYPEFPVVQNHTRSILAAGKINFDFDNLTAEFIPSRTLETHYNVTPLLNPPKCSDCVDIDILQVDPVQKFVKVEITLTNPTALTGYDVRGIAMTNDPHVRLLNADAYTKLWDDGGPVKANPFIAFWTNESDRQFAPSGSDTREYDFSYIFIWGLQSATLIVDASWSDHTAEAYDITNQQVSGTLTTDPYSSVTVSCNALDWQDDIAGVHLIPQSLGHPWVIGMEGTGSVYTTDLTNGYSAPPGRYRIWIKAIDSVASEVLYDDVMVDVIPGPPQNFALKPGECFVEASWSEPEYAAYLTDYRLYKREMGSEYDYGNPIVIQPDQTVYLDEDVLAGHMYFYLLSAMYSEAESELTIEHGAKPFRWGEIVLLSDVPDASLVPAVARGLDDSIWVTWDYGLVENIDEPMTPDWHAADYALLPGSVHWSKIAIDSDGIVHLCGDDSSEFMTIRYIKCDPYDGGVLTDIYAIQDVSGSSVQMAMDATGLIHLAYIGSTPPPYTNSVYYASIDQDGIVSEPVMISSGWIDEVYYYLSYGIGMSVGESGTVHTVWRAVNSEGSSWRYRSMVKGEWGEEEVISTTNMGTKSERILWEDCHGIIHFSDTGSFYFYRDSGVWNGPFDIAQYVHPDATMDYGGGVTGDGFGNVMFTYSWGFYGEITYRQHYGFDWSDEYQLTTEHDATGYEAEDATIVTDKDGLAVVVWYDSKPYGNWEIFMRRQIME